jgi:hypothetical protein
VQNLTATLEAAMSLPSEQLAAMGSKGRTWMERDFAWDSIAQEMETACRWLIDGGDRPSCVRLD